MKLLCRGESFFFFSCVRARIIFFDLRALWGRHFVVGWCSDDRRHFVFVVGWRSDDRRNFVVGWCSDDEGTLLLGGAQMTEGTLLLERVTPLRMRHSWQNTDKGRKRTIK